MLVVEVLVVEDQHGIPVDRLPDRPDCGGIDGLAEIHALDFSSKKRMDLPNFDAHVPPPGLRCRESARLPIESIRRRGICGRVSRCLFFAGMCEPLLLFGVYPARP